MEECKWLPTIIPFSDYGDWKEYQDVLYEIFKKDFIDTKPIFQDKQVNYRKHPMEGKYEHAFIHLTHKDEFHNSQDPNERLPDLRRSERISWNRKIIENYNCNENCINCNKVRYWEQYYKNNVRVYLLFEDVKFMVVIEKRKSYNLLITGYYIEHNYMMRKYINRAVQYKQQKTPLT